MVAVSCPVLHGEVIMEQTLFLACMYGVVDRESLIATNTNKILQNHFRISSRKD